MFKKHNVKQASEFCKHFVTKDHIKKNNLRNKLKTIFKALSRDHKQFFLAKVTKNCVRQ